MNNLSALFDNVVYGSPLIIKFKAVKCECKELPIKQCDQIGVPSVCGGPNSLTPQLPNSTTPEILNFCSVFVSSA